MFYFFFVVVRVFIVFVFFLLLQRRLSDSARLEKGPIKAQNRERLPSRCAKPVFLLNRLVRRYEFTPPPPVIRT